MTRESPRDPPQYSIITFGADPTAAPAERRLSDFPHPYPSIRDLQKEIVRQAYLLCWRAATSIVLNVTEAVPLPLMCCRRLCSAPARALTFLLHLEDGLAYEANRPFVF